MEEQSEKTVYKNSQNSYDEISEKKTSKLGYIFLIIMVIFVIGIGQTIFSDLRQIPERPISPSNCIISSVSNLENLREVRCPYRGDFNEVDKRFGLDRKFNNIKSELQNLSSLNQSINTNNRSISESEQRIDKLNKDYDLSLQEKIADEEAIMDKTAIKSEISNLRNQIITLERKITSLKNQRDSLISQLSSSVKSIEQSYEEALDHYLTVKAWYKFKVFLLTLIFVLPFFVFSLFFYLKLKKKDSPYTIILTALTTAFSILFLQVVLVFLYDILPKEWIERIFELFSNLPFLRYIIYYGSIILVIGLFGGIVYFIQKKVFDPTKVAIRRLKDEKCPGCSFTLDSDYNFCPNCGLQLKEKCQHCEKLKIRYLTHCPNCGKE